MACSASINRNSQAEACSHKAFSALFLCGSELGAKLYLSEALSGPAPSLPVPEASNTHFSHFPPLHLYPKLIFQLKEPVSCFPSASHCPALAPVRLPPETIQDCPAFPDTRLAVPNLSLSNWLAGFLSQA